MNKKMHIFDAVGNAILVENIFAATTANRQKIKRVCR